MVEPKVFRLHGDGIEVLVATAGEYRWGQLLEHRLQVPRAPGNGISIERWMAVDFVDAVRSCLDSGGYKWTDHEREHGGTALIGVRGRLFRIQSNYGLTEPACGYDAAGSGEHYAKASLWTSAQIGRAGPEKRVRLALQAAEAHNGGVMGPFAIRRLEAPDTAASPGDSP